MKTNPILILLTFLMFFFIISCEEEKFEPIETTNHQQLSLEPFEDAIQENLTIQYDDYHEVNIHREPAPASRSADASSEKWLEYTTKFNGYITLEDSLSSRNIFFTLLEHVLNDSSSVFTLLKFVPSIPLDESKVYTYFNLQNFSGTIYTYNRLAEMEYAIGVTDGRVQDIVIAEEEESNNGGARVQYAFPPPDPCVYPYDDCDGGGGSGSWVWQPYKDYTDWFQVTTVGNVNYVQYLGSDYVIRTRYVWVPDNTAPGEGPHEHVSSGNGGHPTSSPHPDAFLKARRLELESLIEQDPFALIEKCDQIQKWQTLAQNKASTEIKNKINQLQSQNSSWFDDWAIQTLNGANGTIVNMDYFSVNVSSLPINPMDNQRFSAIGFLDYFRRNINSFVSGSTFEPYCETETLCSQETTLWNSNNPTGAIVYIDIPGDDGAVICSEYESDNWLFMTLEAPGAGNHPVSGTRQFGFEPNSTGGYKFFVRGVDRFNSNIVENVAHMVSVLNDPGNPFFGADNLWESFQSNLDQFIKDNGGSSQAVQPVKYRPDWEKVKEVLEGNRPISDIGCD